MNEAEKLTREMRVISVLGVIAGLLIILTYACFAEPLDMQKIAQIESSNNPKAYNSTSQARGLYQITPICLTEYNNYNSPEIALEQLFDPRVNTMVAKWYIEQRIPQMLRYFNKPVTLRNQLIAYNAGISYVVKDLPLPEETKNYLKKYKVE